MSDIAQPVSRSADERLCLVDVGGAGGLQEKWVRVADRVLPVVFEPNPAQVEEVRNKLGERFTDAVVLAHALYDTIGTQPLNIAYYWGCTSLRKPNPEILSRYRLKKLFDIVRSTEVSCTRYDVLHHTNGAPAPDVIKVDVQGCEYEVLQGFGGLLQNCLAIELETHLYPIYIGQKLLHDLVALLANYGFVLRRLNQIPSFDTDLIECDAFFTKNIDVWRGLSDVQKRKFRLFCEVSDIVDYARIDPNAGAFDIAPPLPD